MRDDVQEPVFDFPDGYKVIYEMASVEDYLHIRRVTGMADKDAAAAGTGLSNTDFAVQITYNDQCVGYCRVISDGGLWYFMVDGAILPDHQGVGIGRFMVSYLVYHFHQTAPPGAYMMAVSWVPDFVEKTGLQKLEPPEFGMYAWRPITGPGEPAFENPVAPPDNTLGDDYKVLYEMPDADTYLTLRESVGLGWKDPAFAEQSLAATEFAVQVKYKGNTIGLMRILSDRGLWYYIVDGMVAEEHQSTGVGMFILKSIVHHFYDVAAPGAYMLAFTTAVRFGEKGGMLHLPEDEVPFYAWQPVSKNGGTQP
ncbi:MAG: hypothetical protein AAFW47_06455 [Pseudomonadota bacterium]